ncbi:hypothetical protein Syun_000467 [Stephania yunnanensis]|uniref:Uncharacterized protein n=1 Tax=Stephania yunnanensis TaxID=152371 RepID=A0AAP0LBZ6_9MAGN
MRSGASSGSREELLDGGGALETGRDGAAGRWWFWRCWRGTGGQQRRRRRVAGGGAGEGGGGDDGVDATAMSARQWQRRGERRNDVVGPIGGVNRRKSTTRWRDLGVGCRVRKSRRERIRDFSRAEEK